MLPPLPRPLHGVICNIITLSPMKMTLLSTLNIARYLMCGENLIWFVFTENSPPHSSTATTKHGVTKKKKRKRRKAKEKLKTDNSCLSTLKAI